MSGQHQRLHERIPDDETHGAESKCVAHEDKGWPITTCPPSLHPSLLYMI